MVSSRGVGGLLGSQCSDESGIRGSPTMGARFGARYLLSPPVFAARIRVW